MENLYIPKGKYTLEVNFNAQSGLLEMSGSSYPENARKFYQPIFDWIKEYFYSYEKAVTLNLKLYYLNSSAIKCTLDILAIMEEYYKKGREIKVNWLHEEDDDDIIEIGEGISRNLTLPIKFIPYEI